MPPKKARKKVEMVLPRTSKNTMASENSLEVKPKKQKPLTKKEIEKMKRMEKEMKEELIRMKKEAETMLAEFKAMEEAALLKAQQEEEEQIHRVKLLTGTCETFKTARLRLLHENNKIREEETWNRYITTDQKPYPESTPNMHTHLYLWQQQKVTEDIKFALNKSDTYVETLDLLDELIEYPLYSPKQTVANWKELRTEWRREYLDRIDQSCFHLVKNLSKNFRQQLDENHVYTFDFQTDHLILCMSAWKESNNPVISLKWTPKIVFKALDAEFVMPAAYRRKPFILRFAYLDRDFFSKDSLTSSPPPSLPMETDLLKEVHRCFEAKKAAKLSVADREREKVKAAKQKVYEAQEAATQAEKSFRALQEQTKDLKTKTQSRESIKSLGNEQPMVEQRKQPKKESLGKLPEPIPQDSSMSLMSLKRRGVPETLGETSSTAKILMQSVGAMKTLDTISMRSGMRQKQDKVKRAVLKSQEDEDPNVFKTRSMVSVPEVRIQTKVRRDSALCFEETEISSQGSTKAEKKESHDSLDLLLGRGNEEDHTGSAVPTLRQLLKETEVVEREAKQPRMASKTTSTSYSWDGKKRRNRGKSIMSTEKKLTGETDELSPTASDIFEATEDARQEQYLTSLYFQTIPKKHLNLRMYSIVSGTYLLDLISHVSQPRKLANGTSVQIFYGDMNIKRDEYEYKYIPPPPPRPDDPAETVPDHRLQHLLHIKIPLPKNVIFFELPGVALWDREREYWSNEHVQKLEIDMSRKMATFSLSQIKPFAFYLKNFSLLPYTTWTLKPKLDVGGVSLTLKSIFASIEFHLLDFGVSLTNVVTCEGETITQVEDIIGKKMHLHKLIATMKTRGINVFPDDDACLYTENTAKDIVLEEHTNLSIAMWSDTLEFQGCEWNGDFKRRKIAFRVRECLPYNLELRYRTIVASCLSAMIYRQGIEDAAFDESKVENYGFSPDVSNLLEKAFIHMDSSRPVNPLQVLSVYALLCRTKVHSYCGTSRKETPSNSSDDSKKSSKKRTKKQAKERNRKATDKSSVDGDFSEHSLSIGL